MHSTPLGGFSIFLVMSFGWSADTGCFSAAIAAQAAAACAGVGRSATSPASATTAALVSATVAQIAGKYVGFVEGDKITLVLDADGTGLATEGIGNKINLRWRFKTVDKGLLEITAPDGQPMGKEMQFTWTDASITVEADDQKVILDKAP